MEKNEQNNDENVEKLVDNTIEGNEVVLFMKGKPKMPQCGYSERALLLLSKYTDNIKTVDVLENLDDFRDVLEEHSDRRTIPQVFVDEEFIGGSDILAQLDERNELEEKLS